MALKPFKHQLHSLKHSEKSDIVFDCSDPGTGKTAVRVWTFERRRKKKSGAALVLAQRSLLRNVWQKDFKTFAPGLKVSVALAANRDAAFAVDADVYITNIDATKWLAKQKPAFFKKFDELIIDESPAYKHHSSMRSKAAAKIASYFKYRSCMTGTPNSNTICDVWHQVYILDKGKRLGPNFYQFRESVCSPKQMGRDPNAVQWRDKDGAEEAVFGLLSDIVVRHKFEDCVDIPANHQYPLAYDLSAKQLKAYQELEDTSMLAWGAPAVAQRLKGVPVVPNIIAINAAAVATKLLQVASGAVYDGRGGYHLVDTARYEMILDLIEERKHSLCFFLWKHQRDLLVAEADKRGLKFCVIDGSTSDRDRDEYVRGYQAGVYQVMFAHPKSAAHGLTLTKGTATIWSSPTYDLEIFKQGSKRQHRLGQTQKTETIVIVASGTIEQKVYDTMLAKDARMTNLLDLFGSLTPASARRKVA